MAKKTQRQLADEAYLRQEQDRQMLLGTSIGVPPERDTLPGQFDTDGSAYGAQGGASPVADGIPATCPDCGRAQTLTSGWTPLDRSVRAPALQCGACGAIVHTTAEAWETLRAAIKRHFANKPQVQPTNKRTRGAR